MSKGQHKRKKTNFHPSRTSGRSKFLLNLAVLRIFGKKKRKMSASIDMSKPDWSIKVTQKQTMNQTEECG